MPRGSVARFRFLLLPLFTAACGTLGDAPDVTAVPAPSGHRVRQDSLAVPIALVSELGAYGGGYYLLDHKNARVLLVESHGNIRATMGRHGGGPGEFRLPTAAAASADGRLAVLDAPFVTVFDSTGVVLQRFETRPSLGSIAWVCNDSMLAYVGFGDASGREATPIAQLFRDDGTPVRSVGSWPAWSKDMNNSIALLMPTERECSLSVIEAYGTRYGFLSLSDPSDDVRQHQLPGVINPAEVMSRAVRRGAEPTRLGGLIWTNRRAWRIGGDTLLVRQDSTAPDRSVLHRYLLVIGDMSARTAAADLQLWTVAGDGFLFSRQLENGDIEVGQGQLSALLDPLRDALERQPDED